MESEEITPMHSGGSVLATKFDSITTRAKSTRKYRFTSLLNLVTNEEYLQECFWKLKRNKSPGIDNVTVEEYSKSLEENIGRLTERIKKRQYYPQSVKRVYIPKTDGKKRGLGIPTVEDKVVQLGIKRVLEAIYEEVEFMDVSFGFRPKKNCHQALRVIDKAVMTKPVNSVVDMDIEKFFDNLDHKWLMKMLELRIADKGFLRLIGRFLRAGIMEEGKVYETDKGTPQGGVVSPMLANIYLHYALDLWFEKKFKKQLKGYAQLVRFADDFVCLFQWKDEAEKFGTMLKERMSKFGLKISENKSKIISFGQAIWYKTQRENRKVDTFDFLGFTHYCTNTRKGSFKLERKTSRKKMRQKLKAINIWLKTVRNKEKLRDWWRIYRKKIAGHFQYYGISGNGHAMYKYLKQAENLAFKWINRRSQKKSLTWEEYRIFLQRTRFPKPKIYHSMYTAFSM